MDRIENSEIQPDKCAQLISDKGEKAIQWWRITFEINGDGATGHASAKKKESLDLKFHIFYKNELKSQA